MRIRTGLFTITVIFAAWSTVSAGPIDNAQQFQQKAANSALKKNYTTKPRKPVITTVQPQAGASKIINTGNSGAAVNAVKSTDAAAEKIDKKVTVK